MSDSSYLPGEQYAQIVEHAPTMIWRSRIDARCDYFNGTWLEFTGRTLEQELGDGWMEVVHPDDLARCGALYLDHFSRQQPFELEYRLRRRDGVYRYIFDRGVPYSGTDGAFAGFIGSCVDVEERHELERSKTAFLAMMAHELRGPLTPLRGYAHQMGLLSTRGAAVPADMVARVTRQVDRVAALVDHLGEAVRLGGGAELHISSARMDLTDTVRRTVELYEDEVSRRERGKRCHHLALETDCVPRFMLGDRTRLQQVLWNLLDNALKYSPKGGDIAVRVGTSDDAYRVSVRDHGIGIPPDEIPRVTRPYYRASNASPTNYPGVGLGLALCEEVVVRHGGRLELEAELGRGTTVTVMLPRNLAGGSA